ncbi:DciA family protein [Streptomyces violaceusniger]|uniref:DciA family protein n=1 Tax=Streptomyces violaceusniger TaxID=68280 RepID=UPI0037F900AF
MTEPQTSGVDLARVALQAARAAAKQRPVEKKTARRRNAARRGDGRDPIGLGTAISGLLADRGWEAPTTGGSILDQWATLCPNLVGAVQPVHYDAETGRLDLRPVSDAQGAQLRLRARQLAAHLNGKIGREAVREVRVLASGPITPTAPAAPVPDAAPPSRRDEPAPVRTRDDASPGYHQVRDAIHHGPPAGTKPRLEREYGVGEYAHLREPAERFTDAVVAVETAGAAATQGNDCEASRQAARRRAREERAGRTPTVPTAFQRSA